MNRAASGINNGNFSDWSAYMPAAGDMQAWAEVLQKAQMMMLNFAAGVQSPLSGPDSQGSIFGQEMLAAQQAAQQNMSALFATFAPPRPSSDAKTPTDDPAGPAATTTSAATSAAAPFAPFFDPNQWISSPAAQLWAGHMEKMWQQGMDFWTQWAGLSSSVFPAFADRGSGKDGPAATTSADRRFGHPDWHSHPAFIMLRETYGFLTDQLMKAAMEVEGVDDATKVKLQFAARAITDAMSPSNIAIMNPEVMKRAVETRGESLLKGLQNMLTDLSRGQLTHVDRSAFDVGTNIATTPGKVVHETELYQLIHYTPTTKNVREIPLLIFPPWINRFYILDLNPQKSFVRWAVEQGLSVFIVSWKSADASMADMVWDDYVGAQVDAIHVVRDLLDVPAVHSIGYCVAGTTLAATLAMLTARGEADIVRSLTFFTAQVDFELAGDLKHFVDDTSLALLQQLSSPGYLDGRYMAATFNALRGRDLIWNYVVNNYLLGQDYPAFDLLFWNGDTTNLPAKWHQQYLTDLYHHNRLVRPNALTICGTPIDLRLIKTPAFVQAGREDHIAPLPSVWRIMDHLSGPKEFMIAGSGHIAGVVNPPASQKYQYWTGDSSAASLDAFEASTTETKGSWWPYWLTWLGSHDAKKVAAKGARIPGKGKKKAIEDAPGRYVRMP